MDLDKNTANGYNFSMTGADLKAWRKKWGITQVDFAEMLGTYQVTVCRWETGARKIPFLLPLVLEALENRLKSGGSKDGTSD